MLGIGFRHAGIGFRHAGIGFRHAVFMVKVRLSLRGMKLSYFQSPPK